MVCKNVAVSILDGVVTLITGMSKLERLLAGDNSVSVLFLGPPLPTKLTNSILILRIEEQLLTVSELLYDDKRTAHHVTMEVARIFRVRPKYLTVLEQVIRQIRVANEGKKAVKQFLTVPFDWTDEAHRSELEEMWTCLTQKDLPEGSIPPRLPDGLGPISAEGMEAWKSIGFQEPSKDFRGVGVLGLKNLAYFARTHGPRAREVLHESTHDPRYWFPFASTGLNITAWLTQFLDEGHLRVFFYNNPADPLSIFSTIYCFVFLEFSRFWHLTRPKDIMQFGQVSEKFKTRILLTLEGVPDVSHHSEWGLNAQNSGEDLMEELTCWIDGEVHPHRHSRVLQHIVKI
ncbi:unnamed protein product [Vitrella brassicaformis CCMP3155]|uniref:ELMO domain-containing protein n=2 Tax=Vitrella brassicaformis TaxID=1169539 RepID=A0A0G4GTN0_VITBC|nr:unnamed protein product [Vitrella brassicaformis CCMP3155]|eukprot:CEM34075.1 unnamed protein product [Vitrella brassicaformis CCMP3155]